MKKNLFLILLVAAVVMLSGCTLKTVDPVADAAQTILSVNGETVNKAQMQNMVNNYTNLLLTSDMNTLYYYYTYGSLPYTDSQLLDMTIQAATRSMVLSQKAASVELTEEETAQVNAEAEESFEATLQEIIESHLTDTEATGDALREEAIAHAAEEGVTLESLIEQGLQSKKLEKLREGVVADVQVTPEEVAEALASRIAEQKEQFDGSAQDYIDALTGGEEIYYTPEGLRYVKHILIKYTEEAAAAVTDADTAADEANTALETASQALEDAKAALEAAGENAADDLKTAVEEAQAALDEAQAKADEAAAALEEAMAAAKAGIQDKTDEVYAKTLEEGADFDALVAEFNEDPGMTREPYITDGYAVAEGTSYFPEFLEAALKLENPGDISEPVASGSGYHIIRYEKDIPAGEAKLADVEEALSAELLSASQDEAYEAAVQEWINAADVKSYPEKMGL